MALLDDVASTLSLNATSKLARTNDINRYIAVAKAEMARVGVNADVLAEGSSMTDEAIITYCQMQLGNPDYYDRYNASWMYQLDCLRKSTLEVTTDESNE